jgi:DNA-binding MarR family transcriptional regulator
VPPDGPEAPVGSLTDGHFARLLALRVELRRFQHWSEEQAAQAGLTAAQHQLLIAVRGHPDRAGPTITDLSHYLLVRHHSAIGLIHRVEALGLVERHVDAEDHRLVRVRLTSAGTDRVESLTDAHLAELRRLRPLLDPPVDLS